MYGSRLTPASKGISKTKQYRWYEELVSLKGKKVDPNEKKPAAKFPTAFARSSLTTSDSVNSTHSDALDFSNSPSLLFRGLPSPCEAISSI